MSKLKVGLVMPVLNTFDLAVHALYSAKTDHELKVYIQPQYLVQVPLARAWNNGLYQARRDNCDVIIISNDDVIFAHRTIDELANLTHAMGDNYAVAYPVDVLDALDDPQDILFGEGWGTDTKNKEDQEFSCFAVKNSFVDKCGTFDENFDPAWWEDTDMKYRIHLLGYKTLQTDVPYVHLRHKTTENMNAPLNSGKSGEYYYKKWGSNRKTLNESYVNPYNDPSISPKEWRVL